MILKGKKVTLRPMKKEDAVLTAKWGSDPDVNMFTTRKKCTVKEIEKWITKDLAKDKGYKKFVILKENGEMIGNIGLWVEKKDNYAEFDIFIGNKKEWGKGYGTDATKTILDYGFKKLGLHHVYLSVYSYNKKAIGLYEKLGFKHEGAKREHILYGGKYHDCIIMGLLAKEWEKKNIS